MTDADMTIEVTQLKVSSRRGGVVWVERATEVRGWRVQVEALPAGGAPVPAVFVTGEDLGPAQHIAGLLLEKVDEAYKIDQDLSDARATVFDLAAELQQDHRRTLGELRQ